MNNLDLALICQESYEDSTFEERGIEVLIKQNIVCFRGTDEIWPDVLTDIRFFPWWTKELGWTPSGFIKVSKRLVNKVTSELWHRGVKPSDVTLVGHSLGGAVALCVGALMARDEVPPKKIVTFGAPRTGRLKILDSVDVECFKNGKDIVTTVPPIMRRHKKNTVIGKRCKFVKDHLMANYILAFERMHMGSVGRD